MVEVCQCLFLILSCFVTLGFGNNEIIFTAYAGTDICSCGDYSS
jgi:hypothetical protein